MEGKLEANVTQRGQLEMDQAESQVHPRIRGRVGKRLETGTSPEWAVHKGSGLKPNTPSYRMTSLETPALQNFPSVGCSKRVRF